MILGSNVVDDIIFEDGPIDAVYLGTLKLWPAASTTYTEEVSLLNPIGYWRLGELSGVAAVDEGGTYVGTYKNSPVLGNPSLLVDDTNTSVSFDGISSLLEISNIVTQLQLHSTGTVSFLASFPVGGVCSINLTKATSDTTYFQLNISELGLLFAFKSSNVALGVDNFAIRTPTNFLADTVHHIVIVQDDIEGILAYVNGILEVTVPLNAGIPGNRWWDDIPLADSLSINALIRPTQIQHKGTMDEVFILNNRLTPLEISTLYQKSIGN